MGIDAKSNTSGMIEGLKLWGKVCGNKANCESCLIGQARGTGVSCQEFAATHPEKMLSILQEMSKDKYTYFDEFCTRFPECNLDIEILAECVCRRVVFQGDINCIDESRNCVDCWKAVYSGDVDLSDEQVPTKEEQIDEIVNILNK